VPFLRPSTSTRKDPIVKSKPSGGVPAYTAVGTYGADPTPYVATVHTPGGAEVAIEMCRDSFRREVGIFGGGEDGLQIIALFRGDPEPVDLTRPGYDREPVTALAERLLRGSASEYMVTQEDTGGGVLVCQVTHHHDADAAYAWITDSEEATAPFLLGVYLPAEEVKQVSLESVAVQELIPAVYRALRRAESERRKCS
jgi:hypothetical protein